MADAAKVLVGSCEFKLILESTVQCLGMMSFTLVCQSKDSRHFSQICGIGFAVTLRAGNVRFGFDSLALWVI